MNTLVERIKRSFKASFGDIVFGMEDGTVSIFGLVFGVAATTSDSRIVLIAGTTGAIAAAVSMMAGAYLDAETARDQARAAAQDATASFCSEATAERLRTNGLPADAVTALQALARTNPTLPRALRTTLAPPSATAAVSPLGHASWMFVSDLSAALVPVLPFALFPLATARYVSIAATTAVLIVLGIGRAKIGRRRVLSTTLQTLGIAAAAGLAGVLVGRLFS